MIDTGMDMAVYIGALAVFIGYFAVILLGFAYGIVAYVLDALGLFGVGKGLGVKAPWLAWIPYASVWNLGRLVDKTNELCRGKKTHYAKWLLILTIATALASMLTLPLNIVSYVPSFAQMLYESEWLVIALLIVMIGIFLLIMVIATANAIVAYLCYYRVYELCCPEKAVMFLILSIFFSFLTPFFTFYCRNKVPTFEYVQDEYEQETSEKYQAEE